MIQPEKFTPSEALYHQTLATALQTALPVISTDTCARLSAMAFVHGGQLEDLTFCTRYHLELWYVQERFNLKGGESPDADFVELVKHYVQQLTTYEQEQRDSLQDPFAISAYISPWGKDLLAERYKIIL